MSFVGELLSAKKYSTVRSANHSSSRTMPDFAPDYQRRAVSPAAMFSAAHDCRSRRQLSRFFARRHIFFHQHLRSLTYNDDDRALQRIFSTTRYCHISILHGAMEWMQQLNLWYKRWFCYYSLPLRDTAYLSVSWVESLCELFLPVVQSQDMTP